MNTDKVSNYWLYLEPHSFIFEGYKRSIIYNCLNGKIVEMPTGNETLKEWVEQLKDPVNGYCIEINKDSLNDADLLAFARNLQETFSGNVIRMIGHKPFIIPPMPRVIESKERMLNEDEYSSRRYLMYNLNELNLFLPTSAKASDKGRQYASQLLHCIYTNDEGMEYEVYRRLFGKMPQWKLGTLNVVCDNPFSYKHLPQLLANLAMLTSIKKHFNMVYSEQLFENDLGSLVTDEDTGLVMNVHLPEVDATEVIQRMKGLGTKATEWVLVATSEADLQAANEIMENCEDYNVSIRPFFTGENLPFFEQYVFNSPEDILGEAVPKRTIFRRQILNENFFGKLSILPSGEVHANLNCPSLGNIQEKAINEMVYNEMTASTAWFKMRDEEPCKGCVYRYLCASVSNYEQALGKMNLCHVC